MMIACNADKNIDPMSIYGYWESTDLGKDVANPIGLKLDFQSPEYAFIDPVADDTIYFYNYCMIENDSLVLKYKDNITKYCIEKFSDSVLALKFENKTILYKKKYSYNEDGCIVQPKTFRCKTGAALDSLNIIVKSKYEIDRYGEGAFVVTTDVMLKSWSLLLDYLDKQKGNLAEMYPDFSFNTDDYVRQYFGIQEKGAYYVYIYLSDRYLSFPQGYTSWKENIISWDGYTVKIDMDQNKVTDFWSNKYDI